MARRNALKYRRGRQAAEARQRDRSAALRFRAGRRDAVREGQQFRNMIREYAGKGERLPFAWAWNW